VSSPDPDCGLCRYYRSQLDYLVGVEHRLRFQFKLAKLGVIFLMLALAIVLFAGCSGPQTFWTRSRIIPIEFVAPLEVTGRRELRDGVVVGDGDIASIETLIQAAVTDFAAATGRKVRPGDVQLVREHDEVVEPGEHVECFVFRIGRPRMRWIGDDYCATICVGEISSCPREDIEFPVFFRRWLLGYIQERAQRQVEVASRPP
jgi:hypothetical protein